MTLNMLARRTGVSYKEMLALVRRGAIVARCRYGLLHVEDAYAHRLVPLLRVRRMLQESERTRARTLVTVRGVATRVEAPYDFICELIDRGVLKTTRIGARVGFEASYLDRVLPLLRAKVVLYRQDVIEKRNELLRLHREAARSVLQHKALRAMHRERARVSVAA